MDYKNLLIKPVLSQWGPGWSLLSREIQEACLVKRLMDLLLGLSPAHNGGEEYRSVMREGMAAIRNHMEQQV